MVFFYFFLLTFQNRSPELRPFKDQNMGRHDNLFPGFANTNKNSMNSRMGGMVRFFVCRKLGMYRGCCRVLNT